MRKPLGLIITATLVFASLSAADLTITFTAKSKSMMGSGSTGTEIHYYTSAYQMTRGVDSKQDQLVDYGQGISYMIDHKKKTIAKISFDDAMAAMDSMNQAQPSGGNAMMASMFGDPSNFKVEKMGNEKVADRDCQGWHIMARE